MISVVVPAYNEAAAIYKTIDAIATVLDDAGMNDYEIVIVNDGSSDETGAEAGRHPKAVIVQHPHNAGYGQSLKDGIRKARHDTIVICDADMTYPVETIPALVAEYRKGFDMVVGARTGEAYRESHLKAPLRAILRFLVEFTAGRKIPDVNSGLRVFSRQTVMGVFAHLSNTFSFTTSMTLVYMLQNKFVLYVPVPYHARVGVTKVRLWRDSLRTLQFIIQAIAFLNPIKIFLVLCGFTSLLALGGLACGLLGGNATAGWFGGLALLATTILFAMGLLADIIRQTSLQAPPRKDG